MRGDERLIFGAIIAAILALGFLMVNVIFVQQQVQPALEQATSIGSGPFAAIGWAADSCSTWRSPPLFYEPAALSAATVQAVSGVFPDICSQSNPVGCEAGCACILKLKKYCNIGSPDGSIELCRREPCRLQMEEYQGTGGG